MSEYLNDADRAAIRDNFDARGHRYGLLFPVVEAIAARVAAETRESVLAEVERRLSVALADFARGVGADWSTWAYGYRDGWLAAQTAVGEVGTGAGGGATGQGTGTAWDNRSVDCPEAPAQAHLSADLRGGNPDSHEWLGVDR